MIVDTSATAKERVAWACMHQHHRIASYHVKTPADVWRIDDGRVAYDCRGLSRTRRPFFG